MPPHFLSNFEIQKYYQIKPKFNGAYSRNNLTKIKDRLCVINLEDRKSINAHWIALYVNGYNGSVFYDTTYFDRLGIEQIPKDIKKFIGNKNIIRSIYRIQACNSMMCGYFCNKFIEFMLRVKVCLIIQIYFLLTKMKRMIKQHWNIFSN